MFKYRIAYGCWLNDSNQEPIVQENWPSVNITEATLVSLDKTAAFLKKAGYNYFDVFGLITNRSWTSDIVSTVSVERKAAAIRAIETIHRHDLKLIYGLGVYSWGFDHIIAENPAVRGTSKQVMCASSLVAEKVMYEVIDYIVANFDIDGFHLEAADQGRCHCKKCERFISDIDYFNYINGKVISYIRRRWPNKILLVNTSGYLAWGDTFTGDQLEKIIELGDMVDVFIDVGSHGEFVRDTDRERVISRMRCSFGTSGGFWIYPPQRWDRLRWFIPHFKANYAALRRLYQAGGRSCEMFLSPLNNPAAELTILFNGLFLQNPQWSLNEVLTGTVDSLYEELSCTHREKLKVLFSEAEDLFFASWNPKRNRMLTEQYSDGIENLFIWSSIDKDAAMPGEFFLEPLFGIGAGFPCYLTVHFDKDGRNAYKAGMQHLLEKAEALQKETCSEKLASLILCFQNVIKDIETVESVFK